MKKQKIQAIHRHAKVSDGNETRTDSLGGDICRKYSDQSERLYTESNNLLSICRGKIKFRIASWLR